MIKIGIRKFSMEVNLLFFLCSARKGSNPDVIRVARGPQWSPSLERKKLEEAKKGKKTETRRKTLAELALEAGYTVSIQ